MPESGEKPIQASASLVTVQHLFGDDSADYNAVLLSDGVDTVRLDLNDFAQIVDRLFGENGLLSDGEEENPETDLAAIEQSLAQQDHRLVVKRSSRPTVD
jgi:hypothetical protein